MRAAPLLLCCACLGCSEVIEVDLGGLESGYFALILGDPDGTPTRTLGPFVVQDGELRSRGEPKLSKPLGTEVFVLSFGGAALTALDARYDPARTEEVSLAMGPPPGRSTLRFDGAAPRVDAALPVAARLVSSSGAAVSAGADQRLRASLRLTLPVDLEVCRHDHPAELTPFGATPRLIPPERELPGVVPSLRQEWSVLRDVRYLDPDRVVALSPAALYVVARGGDLTFLPSMADYQVDVPAAVVPISLLSPLGRGAALALGAKSGGERALYVAGADRDGPAIWQLAVGPGGARRVATASISARPPGRLRVNAITVDELGAVVAVGDAGLLIYRPAGSSVYQTTQLVQASQMIDLVHVETTHDPRRPHVIGATGGYLFTGDAATGSFETYVRRDRLIGLGIEGLDASPSGELWASAGYGTLLRAEAGADWTVLDLQYPLRLSGCADPSPPGGPLVISAELHGMALTDPAAYTILERCSAVLRVRRSDLCVSLLTTPGHAVAFDALSYEAVDAIGLRAVYAGKEGSLVEAGP